ncbi:MAG: lamin tail domain-containing protein, partial [Planctomycetes bacterium]|nr:lamin tail domain-containing protein [Planctomycetota bacterium]
MINELLAHSPGTPGNWIELYNTTGSQIDIGGWYLSDTEIDLKKYRFADGTKIDAGDYLVFYENTHFGKLS